jgi:hypothetical protein
VGGNRWYDLGSGAIRWTGGYFDTYTGSSSNHIADDVRIGALPGYPSSYYPVHYSSPDYHYFATEDGYTGYHNASGFSGTSDRRRKRKIVPARRTLARLRKLPVYQYEFRDKALRGEGQMGVLAQDFYDDYFPELKLTVPTENNPAGSRTLNPLDVLGVTLRGVQELDTELAADREVDRYRIKTLETITDRLAQEIATLKEQAV